MREAIKNAPPGGLIRFSETINEISLSSQLVIPHALTIDGSLEGNPTRTITLIRGDTNTNRIMHVLPVQLGAVKLKHLLLFTPSGSGAPPVNADEGGAILNEGTLKIAHTSFVGNRAQNFGGAIFNRGNLFAENTTFDKNFTVSTNDGGDAVANTDVSAFADFLHVTMRSNAGFRVVYRGSGRNSSMFVRSIIDGSCHNSDNPNQAFIFDQSVQFNNKDPFLRGHPPLRQTMRFTTSPNYTVL